jgi:predicted aconitase
VGARTNREGGPGALAAALTGVTPRYGLHLDENRRPDLRVVVDTRVNGTSDFGALGQALGKQIEASGGSHIPYLTGIESASLEELKSFCASIATYAGTAIFHMQEITPEAAQVTAPDESITLGKKEIDLAIQQMNDEIEEIDFVTLGCPHLSISEMQRIAGALEGKQVKKEFWITTSRPVKQIADRMGYSATIEASGAKIAADTCCVVAPIKGRFKAMMTDSAKACYYAYTKNRLKTRFAGFEEVIQEALK